MTVKGLWTLDTIYQNENVDSLDLLSLPNRDLLAEGVLYNCSARIEKDDNGNPEPKGNCTEQGLIKFLLDKKCPAQSILEVKASSLDDGSDRIVASIPFNSKRKKASTAIILPGREQYVRIFVKGAPDFMLNICASYIGKDGSQFHLSHEKQEEINNYVVKENFAKQAFRTLLIAYKDISLHEFNELKRWNNNFEKESDREVLERDLCVIGIYGLQDPLRPEIIGSVKKCHTAGITVRMVTGDNLDTAKAIAINANILTQEEADSGEYPDAFMEG
jgi:Ca2+ transporting ATPase